MGAYATSVNPPVEADGLPSGRLASSASIQGTAKLFVVQLNLGADLVMLGFTPGQLTSGMNIRTLP